MALLRVIHQVASPTTLPRGLLLAISRPLSTVTWPPSVFQSTDQQESAAEKRVNNVVTSLRTHELDCSSDRSLDYQEWGLQSSSQRQRTMVKGASAKFLQELVSIWLPPAIGMESSSRRETAEEPFEQGASIRGCSGRSWRADDSERTMAHRPGSASMFDGCSGQQALIPSLSLGSHNRSFHSSPHHSSWFWPPKEGAPPPSPLDGQGLLSKIPKQEDALSFQGEFADELPKSPQFADDLPKSPELADDLPESPKEYLAMESAPTGAGGGFWGLFAPVSGAVVAALDGVHSVTGLPWWSTILVSTLLMRSALLPLIVVQIRKTAQIGALFGQVLKVGGPETPFMTQIQRFAAARKATNCPNPAWFLALPAVQIPIFVSSMLALRQMALECHPGFDTGGALWFVDLTLPAGLGLEAAIFPIAISSLYLTNVQLAFGNIAPRNRFLRVYKLALQGLAVPAFIGSFYLPQGLLLYWVTNNLCSLGQNLAIRSNPVRTALALPPLPQRKSPEAEPKAVPITEETIEKMDVNQLLEIAATCQAQKRPGEAIKFLKKAVVKSPEEAVIWHALGRTHAGLQKWEEAAEYQSQAAGYAKDDELRGKALYGLGIAAFNQDKVREAVVALREAAALRPDDLEGQLSLASVLSRSGEKAEALEVVRKAVRLEPKLQKYIEELETELRTQADEANAAGGKS